MSALEETSTGQSGKDIRGGSQPVVDGVHPALPWPHLPYGDAVYAEVSAADPHPPEVLEAGLRQGAFGALFLRLVWPPGHPGLAEGVRADGLSLVWSHISGWSAHTTLDSRELPVDPFAAPEVLADAALHLCEHGLHCEWTPQAAGERWEHAHGLDVALAAFEDREVLR